MVSDLSLLTNNYYIYCLDINTAEFMKQCKKSNENNKLKQ